MEAVGSVAWNERAVFVVQARSGGFVEKLHARAPLDPVAKGEPLVELLAPDWAAAQEEYLLLRRGGKEAGLAEAARNRLQLLGMSEEQIGLLEKTGKTQTRITLYAPISGVIAELGVREGMTVASGAMLFRLVDLSTVWVNAEVPETQGAVAARPGRRSRRACRAFPAGLPRTRERDPAGGQRGDAHAARAGRARQSGREAEARHVRDARSSRRARGRRRRSSCPRRRSSAPARAAS